MPYPIQVTAQYPERLSRGILLLRLLFGPLYVGVPHGFCLAVYGVATVVVMVVAWFAVLFTGNYPRELYDFVLGYKRWELRVRAYLMFFTDVYPPFSGRE